MIDKNKNNDITAMPQSGAPGSSDDNTSDFNIMPQGGVPVSYSTNKNSHVREVVLTCVVLHNILKSQYQRQHGDQEPGDDDDEVPGDCQLISGAAGGGPDRNPVREAKRQMDYLKDYFNNEEGKMARI